MAGQCPELPHCCDSLHFSVCSEQCRPNIRQQLLAGALDRRLLAELFWFLLFCPHPKATTGPGVTFGSLKLVAKMDLKNTPSNTAVEPLHETLSLFFREEEFSSTFLFDDGL